MENPIRNEDGGHFVVEGHLPIVDPVMRVSPSSPPGEYPLLSILSVTELEREDVLRIWGRVKNDQVELIITEPSTKPLLWDLPYIFDLS